MDLLPWWSDHTWSKWVTAFICFSLPRSFLPRDGRKSPFVRSVNRTAERRWKAAPHPPPPRRHIHNLSERLPRFGLIKYSSGKIVDYAAAVTIAARLLDRHLRSRSLPQWKESVCHPPKRVERTAHMTIDVLKKANEYPNRR